MGISAETRDGVMAALAAAKKVVEDDPEYRVDMNLNACYVGIIALEAAVHYEELLPGFARVCSLYCRDMMVETEAAAENH